MTTEPASAGAAGVGEDAALARLLAPRPSARQLRWQAHEFYAFLHFGVNTMTDREWGTGEESPAIFDPAELDADQWMAALASAGMTGAIITAKHHDGFCLWPSAHTRHSVASSPWRGGRGDLVAEVAAAARRHGLDLGIYLSPWDRADARYGSGKPYDDYLIAQLRELLTGYGPVFSVWFDGACGEGPNGKVQTYDWDRYYATIRELQPGAVINVCGPDVRWCGNEGGHFRADEWSVVPAHLREIERIADASQQAEDDQSVRLSRSDDQDLGSRAALAGRLDDLVWYPAEVNTSIRPGWFHHDHEDDRVRGADELWDIYRGAVGGNATFLLNVPPDRRGLVAAPDLEVLGELGRRVRSLTDRRLDPAVTVSSGGPAPADLATVAAERWGEAVTPSDDLAEILAPPNGLGWWRPADDDSSPTLRMALEESTMVDTVIVKEEISQGQRIEHVVVRGLLDGRTVVTAEAGCVGYQRIIGFAPTKVDGLEIEVTASRSTPLVAGVAVLRA